MQFPGVQNQLDQPIYDTVQLAAATGQTVSFFLVPFNGVLAGAVLKNWHHTNLVRAGSLEKDVSLNVTHMSYFVRDAVAAPTRVTLVDYMAIHNTGHFNVQIGGSSILRIPAFAMPPGPCEMNYFSNIAAAATEFHSNHGISTFGNRFELRNPFTIDSQESIQVDLQVVGAVAAVTDVTFMFWGNLLRPVR